MVSVGKKIVIKKTSEDVWKDCADFLPEDFEKLVLSLHADSRNRFHCLGLIPEEILKISGEKLKVKDLKFPRPF